MIIKINTLELEVPDGTPVYIEPDGGVRIGAAPVALPYQPYISPDATRPYEITYYPGDALRSHPGYTSPFVTAGNISRGNGISWSSNHGSLPKN